jgi:hypothetical protein
MNTLNKKAVSLSLSKAGSLQQTGFDKLTLTTLVTHNVLLLLNPLFILFT